MQEGEDTSTRVWQQPGDATFVTSAMVNRAGTCESKKKSQQLTSSESSAEMTNSNRSGKEGSENQTHIYESPPVLTPESLNLVMEVRDTPPSLSMAQEESSSYPSTSHLGGLGELSLTKGKKALKQLTSAVSSEDGKRRKTVPAVKDTKAKQAKRGKGAPSNTSSGEQMGDGNFLAPLDNSSHNIGQSSSTLSSPSSSETPSSRTESQVDARVEQPWAEPVNKLWQFLPCDLAAVVQYNSIMSKRNPHCSVCAVFQRFAPDEELHIFQEEPSKGGIPVRTLPMIPEASFAVCASNKTPFCDYTPLDDDGLSALLQCKTCSVCVHASCYGELRTVDPEDWTCSACKSENSSSCDIYCALCCLRGGALKPTTDGRWAHIICTLAIGEASFVNVRGRAPIDISNISAGRHKLKCILCAPVSHNVTHQTACVQCSSGRCTKSFHVTCAYAAGVKFEISDWPVPIYVSCQKHLSHPHRSEGRHNEELSELNKGDTVVAKHRNKRFYRAKVLDVARLRLYEVDFDDGSFSEDLPPEDIEGRDSVRDGPPKKGEHVLIRWTDGELYGATFRRVNVQDMYTIEFEDSSQLQAKREELWAGDEEIPKYVKNRMSQATESRFDLFEGKDQSEVNSDGRRKKKKVNYKALGQQGEFTS